jgi:hypothetical protein
MKFPVAKVIEKYFQMGISFFITARLQANNLDS